MVRISATLQTTYIQNVAISISLFMSSINAIDEHRQCHQGYETYYYNYLWTIFHFLAQVNFFKLGRTNFAFAFFG